MIPHNSKKDHSHSWRWGRCRSSPDCGSSSGKMDAPNKAGAQVAADRKRMTEEQLGVPRSLLDRVDVVQARDPPCREVSATEVGA